MQTLKNLQELRTAFSHAGLNSVNVNLVFFSLILPLFATTFAVFYQFICLKQYVTILLLFFLSANTMLLSFLLLWTQTLTFPLMYKSLVQNKVVPPYSPKFRASLMQLPKPNTGLNPQSTAFTFKLLFILLFY